MVANTAALAPATAPSVQTTNQKPQTLAKCIIDTSIHRDVNHIMMITMRAALGHG